MMKRVLTVLFILALSSQTFAQELHIPSFSFSKKKPVYITLADGTEIEGTIKDLDYQKGIIKKIKIEGLDGKNVKMKPENIKCMYLPQSGLDKFSKAMSVADDATKWKSAKLDATRLKKGYVYSEMSKVMMGKKEKELIFQLLNVSFSDKAKIYYDPFAKETMSVGVGGMTLAGGDAKSYYFKKGDEPAYKLDKKTYKKEFAQIWSDCPALIAKYGEDPKWTDFAKHVFEYTNDCE